MIYYLDWLTQIGRNWKSPQDHLIHFLHSQPLDGKHDTIPLLENLFFGLCLIRSRTQENFLEAKTLLNRLIAFESTTHPGRFPLYLHDFPNAFHKIHLLDTAEVLFWILKDAGTLLGDLQPKINELLKRMMASITNETWDLPLHKFKSASLQAIGNSDSSKDFILSLLEQIELDKQDTLFEIWTILELLEIPLPEKLKSLFEASWHQESGQYVGPDIHLESFDDYPMTTSLRLALSHATGFPLDLAKTTGHPKLLRACLYHPLEALQPVAETFLDEPSWHLLKKKEYAALFQKKDTPYDPMQDKGYYPFIFFFGSPSHPRSIAVQSGKSSVVTSTPIDGGVRLRVEFLSPKDVEPDPIVLSLFLDRQYPQNCKTSGKPATVFSTSEPIDWRSGKWLWRLSLHQKDESDAFIWHFNPGNRPSQINHKDSRRYLRFDNQLFLRAVRVPEIKFLEFDLLWLCETSNGS